MKGSRGKREVTMDYKALKAKEEEIRAKREKLSAECEKYQQEIYTIQRQMQQMDHTKVRLDSSQEHILRLNLHSMRDREYCGLTFYKDDASRYDRYDSNQTVHHNDSIINIQSSCRHETLIATLSDHAFEICCEVLGQPHGNGDLLYTWILRK